MDPLTKILHVQPFGFFYLLSKRLWVLCKVPFQTVLYILRINKLRPSWTLKKVLILDAVRELLDAPSRTGVTGGRDHTVEVAAKDCPGARFIWVDAIPSEWVVGEIKRLADACGVQPVRIPAYGFGKWDQDLARDGEKVVLNFHGGGYVAATAHPEDITSNIPRGYVQHGISRVLSLDYRLSSAHPYPTVAPFPAALLDALAGYTYLVRTLGFKPQNVIVSGDSAGGNLALALARYLRDTPELGLGMPGGLVLVSPWADPVCTFLRTITDDSPARVNAKTDFIDLPRDESDMEGRHRYALRALIGPISIEEAGQNPYITPGSIHLEHETGSFRAFPPSYVISGDAEVFVQQIRVLQSRMKEGCEVVYDEVVDAVHDFIVIPQWEPERSNTLRKIVDWIHSLN